MRSISPFLIALGVALVADPAAAQERPWLPDLDDIRFGLRSLQSGGDAMAGGLHGGVSGDASLPETGGWQHPFLRASLGGDYGAARMAFTHIDMRSEVEGQWAAQRGLDNGAAGRSRPLLTGRHRLAFEGQIARLGPFWLDLGLGAAVTHSESGLRGTRRYDVGPAGFEEVQAEPTLWLTLADDGSSDEGDDDGPPSRKHRTSGGFALALDYGLRHLHYHDTLLTTRTSHRFAAAVAVRERQRFSRATVRFAEIAWTESHTVGATVGDQATRLRQLDVSLAKTRFLFVERGESGEGEESTGAFTASVSGHLGAGLQWRPFSVLSLRPEALVHPDEAVFSYTPTASLAMTVDGARVGGFGLSVVREAGTTPLGELSLGVTRLQVLGHLAPERALWGMRATGSLVHLAELEDESIPNTWQGSADLELYVRPGAVEVGVHSSALLGPPSGSIGWDPMLTEAMWTFRGGAFVRARGEWLP